MTHQRCDVKESLKLVLRRAGGKLSWMKLLDDVVTQLSGKHDALENMDIEDLKLRILASIPLDWCRAGSCQVTLPKKLALEGQSLRGERVSVDYAMADGSYSSYLGWIIDGTQRCATIVFDDAGEGWTVAKLKLKRCSHRLLGFTGSRENVGKDWNEDERDRLRVWMDQSKTSEVHPSQMHAWMACELGRCISVSSGKLAGSSVGCKLVSMTRNEGNGRGCKLNVSGIKFGDVVESLQRLSCARVQEIYDDIEAHYPGKISSARCPGKKTRMGNRAISTILSQRKHTLFVPSTDIRPRKYSLNTSLLALMPDPGTSRWRSVLQQYMKRKKTRTKRKGGCKSLNYVRAFGQMAGR
eukprot:TRINITY_DN7142_c0_g1_i5.p1 TRINITY_DN7142_c0_g1~~TRINITY_DN7142_c0_g1_i5.p1  ORF type:complete len:354 (-),score=2.06 TRINITY_DN7142_c0_g1_i5:218-1279(-)